MTSSNDNDDGGGETSTSISLINNAISTDLLNDVPQITDGSQHIDAEMKNDSAQIKNEKSKEQSGPVQLPTQPPKIATTATNNDSQPLPDHPPQSLPPIRKRGRPKKGSASKGNLETWDFTSGAFRKRQAEELAYYNNMKRRKQEGSTTELLYYNIVTAERGPGKRRVKARDYVDDLDGCFDDNSNGFNDEEYNDNDNDNDYSNNSDSDFL